MVSMIKTYYRRITESLPQRIFFINYFFYFLCVLFIFTSILVALLFVNLTEAEQARKETLGNFSYWVEISEKHPNSPDAFFEAGYYAAKLGDKEKAVKYLSEAIRLDPEFEKAIDLEKALAR